MPHNIRVTPHSQAESAIKATMHTLQLPPLSVADMEVIDGKIEGLAPDPHFVQYACDRQGYAKSVEILVND